MGGGDPPDRGVCPAGYLYSQAPDHGSDLVPARDVGVLGAVVTRTATKKKIGKYINT